jgi:hypothetical protein
MPERPPARTNPPQTLRAEPWKPSSLAEAKRNAVVNMTASSGTRYAVRPLTLDELIAENGMPDELIRIALLDSIRTGPHTSELTAEISEKLRKGDKQSLGEATDLSRGLVSLRDRLVVKAVQAPKLKAKDLEQLDPYDLDEIAAVAQHRLVVDEAGRLVDPLATFQGAGGE